MVDGDDGYGDAENVAYTVSGYEALGVQALFIEDQLLHPRPDRPADAGRARQRAARSPASGVHRDGA